MYNTHTYPSYLDGPARQITGPLHIKPQQADTLHYWSQRLQNTNSNPSPTCILGPNKDANFPNNTLCFYDITFFQHVDRCVIVTLLQNEESKYKTNLILYVYNTMDYFWLPSRFTSHLIRQGRLHIIIKTSNVLMREKLITLIDTFHLKNVQFVLVYIWLHYFHLCPVLH